MPRRSGKVPSYCHHRASGKAVVRIDGFDHYLGKFGSPESHVEYERRIAEWRIKLATAEQDKTSDAKIARFSLTLAEVLYRFTLFAEGYYVHDGKPTKELTSMKHALRPLRQLYGNTLAREFGPLGLKAVRQQMLSADLCRGVVNHRINRIKRFFKWAVSEELMPVSVYESLRTVAGLRLGKTEARESDPVRPVPDACVEATLEAASPQIAAMIRVQRLTGMRPCEVVIMRGRDIDRSADVWVYAPSSHKSQWRGLHRHVPLGPKAQAIIEPFLTANLEAHLFSPKDAETHRNAQRKAARKSPMTPSQSARRPLAIRKRPTRDSYDVDSYRRAISYAIKKANAKRPDGSKIPHWFPLQLRHSRATEIRRGFGIEAAQVSLGHAHANVTEVYAERNLSLAIEIARKTG